jgi:hypothetical protein
MLVLDWNLIQSMPSEVDVPERYECVVLDQMFHEVVNKDPGYDEGAIRKLGRWAARNVHRLWVGHTPEKLFERQFDTGKPLSVQDIIHPGHTRELRRTASLPDYDWTAPLRGARDLEPVRNRRHQIETLVRLCTAIAEVWRSQPGKRTPNADEKGDWIRQAHLVTDLVERFLHERWRREWRRQVDNDPNRFAVVRWARFVAWYCLRRAEGHTRKYENNFDDAHYGLLASYAGHLGTADKGLREAATTIFPKLRVLDLGGLVGV